MLSGRLLPRSTSQSTVAVTGLPPSTATRNRSTRIVRPAHGGGAGDAAADDPDQGDQDAEHARR